MPKYYPSEVISLPGEKNVIGIAMTNAPMILPTTIKKTSLLNEKSILAS